MYFFFPQYIDQIELLFDVFKNKIMQKITIFLILCFAVSGIVAQNWYDPNKVGELLPGIIVTTDGDTIEGKIRYDAPPAMARRIHFEEEGFDELEKYKAKALQSFFFEDTWWVAKEFNDGSINLGKQKQHHCLRVVEMGKLNMYEYYTMEMTDWVEQEGNVITIMPSEMKMEYILQMTGDDMVSFKDIRFLQFKKSMSKYLADCPAVTEKIQAKEYKRKDIVEIVKVYNAECGE